MSDSIELRCDAVMNLRTELARSETDLLRGVPVEEVLAGLGIHFDNDPSTPRVRRATADLSVATHHLDYFVSHSWRASAWKKHMALCFHFNGLAALIAGYTGGFVAFILSKNKILPRMGTRFAVSYNISKPRDFSAWCMIFGTVAFVIVLLHWQHLRRRFGQRSKFLFVDRLCISQTDPETMQLQVAMLGAFVASSKRLVALTDETFLTRLWCIAEIGAFIYCNPPTNQRKERCANLIIISLERVTLLCWMYLSAVLVTCLYYFIGSCSGHSATCHHLATLVAKEEDVAFRGSLVVPTASIVCWLLLSPLWFMAAARYARYHSRFERQLAEFNVRDVDCSLPEDRTRILSSLHSWFGSLAAFEEFVKVNMKLAIFGRSRSLPSVPVWYCFVIALPTVLLELDLRCIWHFYNVWGRRVW